jgi:GMP synthase (glutamine-hydrolysing)
LRRVMVFQHAGHEPLGTLNPLLKASGLRLRYVNFAREPESQPDIRSYSGLVILGGPMGVYESDKFPHLAWEMKQIEQALKMDIPVLGICLGAQLLAQVLGSPVKKAHSLEFGWHDIHLTQKGQADPLFSDFSASEKLFQYHQDMFEPPKSAEHLAFSSLIEGQAFRYGTKAYGLQFHLEADLPMIQRWLTRPDSQAFIQNSNVSVTHEQVLSESLQNMDRSLFLSLSVFQKWISFFPIEERAELLGSNHARPLKRK